MSNSLGVRYVLNFSLIRSLKSIHLRQYFAYSMSMFDLILNLFFEGGTNFLIDSMELLNEFKVHLFAEKFFR